VRTIGFYDESPTHSGTTQYLLELLGALDRSRYAPVVFSRRPVAWHDACIALDAEVVTSSSTAPAAADPESDDPGSPGLPAPRPSPWIALRQAIGLRRWFARETRALATLFQQHPVDLLHSNHAGEEPAPFAARQAKIPVVIGTLHVDPTYDLFGERRSATHRALQRKSLAALDLAIAVSSSTEQEWRKHLKIGRTDRPTFAVVPNGIRIERLARRHSRDEAKELLGIPATTTVFGSAGRLDWAKGYGDLVTAMPAILAALPDTVFVHAGRGPLAGRLAREATSLGVSDRIRWLGFRPDVRDLLEACDLYVQPSWCEAQGLAVLEAGALDIPALVTDVGGMPESVDRGAAGWVVAARNPDALAAGIVAAIRDPADRGQRLGDRVRKQYTSERMVRDTMSLYDSL
jgi:glycosyltransferase involved in cell wall biosynthesis